jgi:hypothetical protein
VPPHQQQPQQQQQPLAAAVRVPTSPDVPQIQLIFPRPGSAITTGATAVVQFNVSNFRVPEDGVVCIKAVSLDDGATRRACFNETALATLATSTVGAQELEISLRRRENDIMAVAVDSVRFHTELPDACAGKFGIPPCGTSPLRCATFSRFRFYLYESSVVPSSEAASIYYALKDSLLRTTSPEDACLFVAIIDPMVANTLREAPVLSAAKLPRLAHWGPSGDNHLLIHYADYAVPYDTQHAVLAKSSFGPLMDRAFFNPARPDTVPQLQPIRPGFDVVIPFAFYRCNMGEFTHLERYLPHYRNGSLLPPGARTKYLITFKGSLYRSYPGHMMHIRHYLRDLHNGRDVIMALTCSAMSVSCGPDKKPQLSVTMEAPYCSALDAEAARFPFDDLMLNSRFVAVVPGEGSHSYRLYEALGAGAIPVMIGESALPLSEIIAWEDIAIIQRDASPAALEDLVQRLRTIPASRLNEMQRLGRLVLQNNFAELSLQLHSTMAALTERYRLMVKEQRSQKAAAAMAPALGTATDMPQVAAAARIPQAAAGPMVDVYRLSAPIPANSAIANPLTVQIFFDASEIITTFGKMAGEWIKASKSKENWSVTQRYDTKPLRVAVNLLLHWIQVGVTDPIGKPHAGPVLARAYFLLSQSYGLLGHWRLAATAASSTAVVTPEAEANAPQLVQRIRNSMYDTRRAPAAPPVGYDGPDRDPLPAAKTAEYKARFGERLAQYLLIGPDCPLGTLISAVAATGPLLTGPQSSIAPENAVRSAMLTIGREPSNLSVTDRFYRILDELNADNDKYIGGYGVLAHFLSPAPLASPDAPGAAVLPLSPCGINDYACDAVTTSPDVLMSMVGVSEGYVQRIAAAIAPELPLRLGAFMKRHNLVKGRRDLNRGVASKVKPRIAIVSLCAYDRAKTRLEDLSTENLSAYCDLHNYDCFLGSESLDENRPIAWSKIMLVAKVLPLYDWVMWRDCDSFFLDSSVTVEDFISSAAHARGLVAQANNKEHRRTLDFFRFDTTCSTIAGVSGTARIPRRIGRANRGFGGKDPIGERKTKGVGSGGISASAIELIIGEDGFMLNSGMFVIRNTPWAMSFLRRVYGDVTAGASLQPSVTFNDTWCSSPVMLDAARDAEPIPLFSASHKKESEVVADEAVAAMKASRRAADKNRAWEQASIFSELAETGVSVMEEPGFTAATTGSVIQLDPMTYADVVRVQSIPQAWFNGYPLDIAKQLYDHERRPMHMAYEPGDWVISFSGCGVLLGSDACEALFLKYAAMAKSN